MMMRLVMMISESGSQGRKRCGMMMDGQERSSMGGLEILTMMMTIMLLMMIFKDDMELMEILT